MTISELARRSGTVKSNVSKTVDQLTQQGWLRKEPDPLDQRLLRVYKNDCSSDEMAKMQMLVHEAWSRILPDIRQDQLEGIVDSLRLLLEALERANATAATDTPLEDIARD